MLVTVCPECKAVNDFSVQEYGTIYHMLFLKVDRGIALEQVDADGGEMILVCESCGFEWEGFNDKDDIGRFMEQHNMIQDRRVMF